jgi:hypothetical protein
MEYVPLKSICTDLTLDFQYEMKTARNHEDTGCRVPVMYAPGTGMKTVSICDKCGNFVKITPQCQNCTATNTEEVWLHGKTVYILSMPRTTCSDWKVYATKLVQFLSFIIYMNV